MYIVKSGGGYVANAKTLEMVGDRTNDSNAALNACRLSFADAARVSDRLAARGFYTEIVELRIG